MPSRRNLLAFGAVTLLLFFTEYQFAFSRDRYYNYYKRTVSRPITIRRDKNTTNLNIGILVVLDSKAKEAEYRQALDSLRCYTTFHKYSLELVYLEQNKTLSRLCPHSDFMFKRHCIAALSLPKYDWMLFVDGDVGVINPNHLIEEWIDERVNVILYDRLFNHEVMAGSYLIANSSYSVDFLNTWANYEFKLPDSFHGTDNGAIQTVLTDKLIPHAVEERLLCSYLWNKSKNYKDLYIYETCARFVLGANRLWDGQVKILPKGKAWARDGWLTGSMWSPRDFMFHGWQRTRQDSYRFASWPNPLSDSIDMTKCSLESGSWSYKDTFIRSDAEISDILKKCIRQVEKEFWKTAGDIRRFV
uniref:Uncharacterized protein n=1 Tax=Plectus sambesii TaxID=2011161 RepID=A0A914VQU8_9BILA